MSVETDVALMGAKITVLEEKNKQLSEDVAELKRQDKNRMKTAIGTLGGLVIALGTYIWAFKVDGK